MDRLSGDLRILSSPANIKAFFGVDIVLSNFSSFFSFFPVSTITTSLFMYFSCANFLHSSPKLACVSTHASVIRVDDNSSSIHPVCISGGFIVNLIPKMIIFSSFVFAFVFESSGFNYFIQLLTDYHSFIDYSVLRQNHVLHFRSLQRVTTTMVGTTCYTVSTQHRTLSGISLLYPSVD